MSLLEFQIKWEVLTTRTQKKLKNPEVYNVIAVAERLHKTIPEILQMSCFEFNMWIAYFEQQNEKK